MVACSGGALCIWLTLSATAKKAVAAVLTEDWILKLEERDDTYRKETIMPPTKIKIKERPTHLDTRAPLNSPTRIARNVRIIAITRGLTSKRKRMAMLANSRSKMSTRKIKRVFPH